MSSEGAVLSLSPTGRLAPYDWSLVTGGQGWQLVTLLVTGGLLYRATVLFQEGTGSQGIDTGWLGEALEKLPASLEERPERNASLSLGPTSMINNKYSQALDTGKMP